MLLAASKLQNVDLTAVEGAFRVRSRGYSCTKFTAVCSTRVYTAVIIEVSDTRRRVMCGRPSPKISNTKFSYYCSLEKFTII